MPTFAPGFRPATYWDENLTRIAAVKGTLRQNLLIEEAASGIPNDMPELLRQPSLPPAVLVMVRAIDAAFVSGEYLPDLLPGETEIARITRTRTPEGGVCSIRAQKTDTEIRYRAVDEEGGDYTLARNTSADPLTLRELTALIDTARCTASDGDALLLRRDGLVLGEAACRLQTLNPEPLDLLDFLAASSVYYPGLEDWYEHALVKWIRLVQNGTRPPIDSEAVLKMPLEAGTV